MSPANASPGLTWSSMTVASSSVSLSLLSPPVLFLMMRSIYWEISCEIFSPSWNMGLFRSAVRSSLLPGICDVTIWCHDSDIKICYFFLKYFILEGFLCYTTNEKTCLQYSYFMASQNFSTFSDNEFIIAHIFLSIDQLRVFRDIHDYHYEYQNISFGTCYTGIE